MLEHEISRVVSLRDSENKTFKEIGAILGFSERTAKRRYQAGVLAETSTELAATEEFPLVDELELPEITSRVPTLDRGLIERFTPLTAEGDAFVISDIHVPLHDARLFNLMLQSAEKANTDQLIINGDYWHQEFASSFLPFQPEANLEAERYHGNVMMKTLLGIFDHVWLTCGNHDFRLVKKTGFRYSFQECMDWMFVALTDEERSRLYITSLDYMYYWPTEDWEQPIRVCHPRNFSVQPLTVSRALAVKYGTHVLTGHSHHLSMGFDQSGTYLIGDTGGFFDPYRTEYIQSTGKGHNWVQGWWEFKDGIPTIKSPLLNNV